MNTTNHRSNSYYTASINSESDHPQLSGQHRVDVAIVGGGFTGIATGLELAERGLKVAIIEAKKIGWGATGRNGGQVTGSLSGDDAMVKKLKKKMGSEAENFVWNLRWRGHDIIKNRVEKYNISCDLKHGHLHAAYKASHLPSLENMANEANLRGMGDDVTMLTSSQIPEYLETSIYHGGLLNRRNMHVHPLNLCLGEAHALQSLGGLIFENSEVTSIEHGDLPAVITKQGEISANSVLLAGNAYHKLERRKLQGTLFPASLGCMTTKPLGEEIAELINPQDLAVYDSRFVLDYYRMTADKRLLFGGGTNYSGRDSKSIENELRPAMEKTFPRLKDVEIEYEWTGTAGIVLNRIPLVGKVSKNVFYCQGYSGHGLATSHIMGDVLSNAISGSLEEYSLFESMSHLRLPMPEWVGSQALAIGMMYYRMLERFR